MKKQYNGLDLLKFFMALMVVMIHVSPSSHSQLLTNMFRPLLSIAVPMFFTISSTLLFCKVNIKGGGCIFNYCKRIGILYLCWLLIDSWFIIVRKPYFDMGIWQGLIEFIKDVIFGTTFPGSWYLSASVMGVLFVYSFSKVLGKYVVFIFTIIIALYVSNIEQLPLTMQIPYDWYAANLREEVSLSFPAQMVWISLGQILSLYLTKLENNKRIILPVSAGLSVVAFVAFSFLPLFLLKVMMVLSLFVFCFLVQLADNKIYKRLRNYSILMFFFHFSIAGKMALFCGFVGDTLFTNWLYYIIVVTVSVIFSEVILQMEKYKLFSFLRYLH
ncbi:MAG: hypothetical protein IKY27_08205 [Bacteroidales bacterium]|nr:hypothetical protein [Bacteroidales bacterium]